MGTQWLYTLDRWLCTSLKVMIEGVGFHKQKSLEGLPQGFLELYNQDLKHALTYSQGLQGILPATIHITR